METCAEYTFRSTIFSNNSASILLRSFYLFFFFFFTFFKFWKQEQTKKKKGIVLWTVLYLPLLAADSWTWSYYMKSPPTCYYPISRTHTSLCSLFPLSGSHRSKWPFLPRRQEEENRGGTDKRTAPGTAPGAIIRGQGKEKWIPACAGIKQLLLRADRPLVTNSWAQPKLGISPSHYLLFSQGNTFPIFLGEGQEKAGAELTRSTFRVV